MQQNQQNVDDDQEEGISRVLWRRRWIICGVTLLSVVAAGLYLIFATPMYEAQAKLYVAPMASSMLPGQSGEARLPDNYLRTQCEVIRSIPLLVDAIKRSGSTEVIEPEDLRDALEVQAGRLDDIISISLRHRERIEARELVRAVADAYLSHQMQESQKSAAKVLAALRQQQQQRSREIDQKHQQIQSFQKENAELSFESERGNVIVERLSRLSETLTGAQQRRVEAEASYAAAAQATASEEGMLRLIESLQTHGGSTPSDPEYAELQRQLHSLEVSTRATEGRVGSAHPSVRAAQQAVAALRSRIAEKQKRFADAHLALLRQQRDAARRAEADVQALFTEQYKQAVALNSKMADQSRMRSELARIERGSDTLDTRLLDLGTLEQTGTMNVSLVEAAYASNKPVSPKKAAVLGGGFAAGLLVSVLLALVLDRMDGSFRSAQQIQGSLQMGVVAAIPHEHGRRPVSMVGRVMQREPNSAAAEAYRFLRSAVEGSLRERGGKVLLVTSTLPSEGKTTVAANLALALAEAGRRVLLVDGDLRRPAQRLVFATPPGPGLSEVLNNDCPWQEAVQPSGVDSLELLVSGGSTSNPAGILHSARLPEVLRDVREHYDVVLVDSPPAGIVSDAHVLAPLCDSTLLVVRTKVTSREMCQEACSRLARTGAHLTGVVVNDVARQALYGGYGYYGYGNAASDGRELPGAMVTGQAMAVRRA
jgi:capsular exopolysaccharide synthesis family protein